MSGQTTHAGTSTVEIPTIVAYLTVAMLVLGLAVGLLPMLYGSNGANPLEDPDEQQQREQLSAEERQQQQEREQDRFQNQSVQLIILFGFVLPVMIAPIVGMVVSGRVPSESTALAGAAAGMFVGTMLFMLVSGFLAAEQLVAIDGFSGETQKPPTLDIGQLLLNSVYVAIPAAIAAAGGVFAGGRLRD